MGKRFDYFHSKKLAKHYAIQVDEKIKDQEFDLIFAPTASTLVAYLDTSIPIISISDATIARMIDYYESYTNLSNSSIKQANEIERRNIEKSSVVIYASNWAAKSAIEDYGASKEKIKVIPLGANLLEIPEINSLNFNKSFDEIHFLFLGVDWERKGGEIVLKTMQILRSKGINTFLTICGCTPNIQNEDFITIIPFINKNTIEGEEKIATLFQKTHFLFLPSKAECFGIVFCEASAFGVPSLTVDTGGIGNAVIDGVNGFKLKTPLPELFSELITELIESPEKYRKLSKSSRHLFEEKLNWKSWMKDVKTIIEEVVIAQK
jgi:glycosyltransferase involved in cell wall biosynthesis